MSDQLGHEKSVVKELRTSARQLEEMVKETVTQYETVKSMNRVLEKAQEGQANSEGQEAESDITSKLLTHISDLKLEMGN